MIINKKYDNMTSTDLNTLKFGTLSLVSKLVLDDKINSENALNFSDQLLNGNLRTVTKIRTEIDKLLNRSKINNEIKIKQPKKQS